jgi:DNA polymerase-3 subunit beta
MKVNFNRAAFAEALGLLTSVIPSRTPKPILRCVRITAREKEVQISATDLEVGINHLVFGVDVGKAGEVVVPADRLAAVVRESADEILSLQAEQGACEDLWSGGGPVPGGPRFRGASRYENCLE